MENNALTVPGCVDLKVLKKAFQRVESNRRSKTNRQSKTKKETEITEEKEKKEEKGNPTEKGKKSVSKVIYYDALHKIYRVTYDSVHITRFTFSISPAIHITLVKQ